MFMWVLIKYWLGFILVQWGCYLLHQVLHFDCSLCTIYYILFTLSYIHSNRHRNSEGLTLLRAAKTLSGMWSLNIRGDISTSSKSVFSAQMAWYTGSCLFRICLETDTRGEGWIGLESLVVRGWRIIMQTGAQELTREGTNERVNQSHVPWLPHKK